MQLIAVPLLLEIKALVYQLGQINKKMPKVENDIIIKVYFIN
jgi:hypothetical protein